jgi:hypothetical protein
MYQDRTKLQLAEQEAHSRLWPISHTSFLSGDSVKLKVPGASVLDGGGGRKVDNGSIS